MAAFKYTGRNDNGNQVKGSLEAASSTAAAEQLFRQNITPISINESSPATNESLAGKDIREVFGLTHISLDELIIFCRQMYALMRSGVPILRAINGMAESSNSFSLKKALVEIGKQLEGGYELSTALHQHPKIFDTLFVSLIHVGENTGQLDESFFKLTTY